MGVDNKKTKRKPGGGRKPSKPDYNPSAILQNQMDAAVALYSTVDHPSLQTIADELNLNPIKVRKLLITAGVYKSDAADQVQRVFNAHRKAGLSHTEAIAATMKKLNLSKASVTSYLPYEKGVYFPAETDSNNLSVGAERIRRMRKRNKIIERVRIEQTEEALWAAVIEFQEYKFRTYSGLVFSYSLKKGRGRGKTDGGAYTKELFIDRRENSKSLAWSSVALAFRKVIELGADAEQKPLVDRPKALGDIRGVTYIYLGYADIPVIRKGRWYMDLKEFYFQNVTETEYHHRFRKSIEDVNFVYNVFTGAEVVENYEFYVYDAEEAITKFRELCQPEVTFDKEKKCWFYLITYYLFKNGYEIKEFPRLLARPPVEPADFTYTDIRNRLIAQGDDDNGTVRYATRRTFVASLRFEQKTSHVQIDDAIDQKFIEISNRNASFNNMSIDEQLAEIANLIEHMLKQNGKFVSLDYSSVCFNYLDETDITSYRKKMHCFRHSTAEAIAERKQYSDEQKSFFVDYGLTIVKVIHYIKQ